VSPEWFDPFDATDRLKKRRSATRMEVYISETAPTVKTETAESKVPSSDDSTAATVTTSVAAHVEAINILIPRLRQITGELEEEIGRHILAIKAAEPNDWEGIVRTQCGISRSRAYELMAIADGVKTTEQTRHETNARKIRHRAKQAVRSGTDKNQAVTDTAQIIELRAAHRRELADARAQFDELEEGRERQIARFEQELAKLSGARNLSSERDQLRRALQEIVELLAETRGLVTHAERNRAAIAAKITRAKAIAESVLNQPKVVNLLVEQVA
jgi:hypothetical protein